MRMILSITLQWWRFQKAERLSSLPAETAGSFLAIPAVLTNDLLRSAMRLASRDEGFMRI